MHSSMFGAIAASRAFPRHCSEPLVEVFNNSQVTSSPYRSTLLVIAKSASVENVPVVGFRVPRMARDSLSCTHGPGVNGIGLILSSFQVNRLSSGYT